MVTKKLLYAGLLMAAGLAPSAANAGEVKNYSPVTQARLEKPEPGNWMLYRRTYDGHGYSPLTQINTDNVKDLQPAWTFATGVVEGHEAPPLVNNGVMFVTTPEAQVLALDAKTGKLIWRYKHALPEDLFQLHPTNRGVGMWEDKLFLATTDDYLIALDAKTGKQLWKVQVQKYKKGQYLTLMPLIVEGKVIIGGSGGELGVRGYVIAYDAKDGKQLWKTYTIPGPGEPGHETWHGDDWKTGGGSAWMTGNYDPELRTIYWGVGNAAPWPGSLHGGDNLFTSSVIGLDPDTGKIKAYHQYHQNDSWDWDEVEAPMLIDLERGGRKVKSLVHPGRDAVFWVLERAKDKIDFVAGWKFVYSNVFKGLDEKGKPIVDVAHKPTLGKRIEFCPSLWGGKDWPSGAYSEQTKLVYVPANENFCGGFAGVEQKYEPGKLWLGTKVEDIGLKVREGFDHMGEIQAWDPATGKKAWQHNFARSQMFGSVLATAGGLVFAGGTNDRMFRAFDAKTGKVLWKVPTGSGIMGMPTSFEVDGTQYIAVQSGWGVDAQRIQTALVSNKIGIEDDVPQGGAINVYALPKKSGE